MLRDGVFYAWSFRACDAIAIRDPLSCGHAVSVIGYR